MLKRLSVIKIAILALMLASCEDNASSNGYIIKYGSEPPLFKEIPTGMNRFVTAKLLLSCDVSASESESSTYTAVASLYSYDYSYVDAGVVTINTDTLAKGKASEILGLSGNMLDILPVGSAYKKILDSIDYTQDYRWTVQGNNLHEPLDITVAAPSKSLRLTTPDNGQIVRKSEDLSIRWESEQKLGGSVRIYIYNAKQSFFTFVDDTGEYLLSKDSLSRFSDGLARLEIIGGNSKLVIMKTNYYALAAVYFRSQLEISLTK